MTDRAARLAVTHAARTAGRTLRITAFGSSTTEGSGASGPDATYPAVMRRALLPAFPGGVAVTNLGIGGESAIEMDARLDQVIRSEPHLILWQTGSNDLVRPVPLDQFERLTRRGRDRLAATGADLVLIDQQYSATLEACPALPAFLAAVQAIGDEAGVPVFPRYRTMRAWCEAGDFTIDSLSPDGMHMNDPGYARLGGSVADWVRDRS